MKGDFTRDTFKAEKHYQQVRMQQGRAQLDADWNEQAAINVHRDKTTTRDIIGCCGGPADNAAFGCFTDPTKLTARDKERLTALFGALPAAQQPIDVSGEAPTFAFKRGGDFFISAGCYYVDGIQCENEFAIPYTAQPDRSDIPALANHHSYLLYLDVWLRHVTAVEDGDIREAALGGADTATRVKTVWQVRALELPQVGAIGPCSTQVDAFADLLKPSGARLKADTAKVKTSEDPCEVPESAGYKGLENQLYRVEIHQGSKDNLGNPTPATWKWSRENGSVVTPILRIDGDTITVSSLGPDERLGFRSGDWVEILDDAIELEGQPGQLLRVASVNADQRMLEFKPTDALKVLTTQFPDGVDPARHPKLRRWEGTDTLEAGKWLPLESGVQIQFDDPAAQYRTGEYWQIPARAATATAPAGEIEWLRDDQGKPIPLPPRGIRHHYCRIGIVSVNGTVRLVSDCRCLWPALTSIPRLFYVSGDGQEVMPDLTQPKALVKLLQPLIVGVANAQCLRQSAKVRFTVEVGSGQVAAFSGTPSSTTPKVAEVTIDPARGLAECDFYLDGTTPSQRVVAQLLDATNQPVSPPIIFNANLSIASQVAYEPGKCSPLAAMNTKTVQEAIDNLCAGKRCEGFLDDLRCDGIVRGPDGKMGFEVRKAGSLEITYTGGRAYVAGCWYDVSGASISVDASTTHQTLLVDDQGQVRLITKGELPEKYAAIAVISTYQEDIKRIVDVRFDLTHLDEKVQTNAANIAADRPDRRQFVPLLAYSIKGLQYRDGRNKTFDLQVAVDKSFVPSGLATDGENIWVANTKGNSVARIPREATDKSDIEYFDLESPTKAVAYDGCCLWFTALDGTVVRIDAETGKKIDSIQVGGDPRGIVFDGDFLWVCSYEGQSISAIDVETCQVVRVESLQESKCSPDSVVFDGTHIWVAASSDKFKLLRIEKPWGDVEDLKLDNFQYDEGCMAFDGNDVWVLSTKGLRKIDINDPPRMQPVNAPSALTAMTFDGSSMWVFAKNVSIPPSSSPQPNLICRIDVVTNQVLGSAPLEEVINSAICDGTHLWMSSSSSNSVLRKLI
ncbi:MAG: DUF6519 domain-containing protein [Bacteroidota bacterium]